MNRLLYISEDYYESKVHHNLCRMMATQNDVAITVYSPKRRIENSGCTINQTYRGINYETLLGYISVNPTRYKFDFSYKIRKKYGYLDNHVDLSSFDRVYAATLFSEGATAYRIFKKYNIPYTVAVRGTDISLYLKFMPHLCWLGRQIIKHAYSVIFVTDRIKQEALGSFVLSSLKETIERKSTIITNGIDDIWFGMLKPKKQTYSPHKVIYIGNLGANKNVLSLQDAIEKVREVGIPVTLSIIGGSGDQENTVLERCRQHPEYFFYLGKIYDKKLLAEKIREHDLFAMCSHGETFGLVYLEALSQGIPVVYSKGQGIDGCFTEKIGEAANSHSVDEIASAIKNVIANYSYYTLLGDRIFNFKWENISKSYYQAIFV